MAQTCVRRVQIKQGTFPPSLQVVRCIFICISRPMTWYLCLYPFVPFLASIVIGPPAISTSGRQPCLHLLIFVVVALLEQMQRFHLIPFRFGTYGVV